MPKPWYSVIAVPVLFPDTAAQAKKSPSKKPTAKSEGDSNVGREVVVPWKDKAAAKKKWEADPAKKGSRFPAQKELYPARQYPAPGGKLADLEKSGVPARAGGHFKDYEDLDVPLFDETKALMALIERFHPKRIASVHAHRFTAAKKETIAKADAPKLKRNVMNAGMMLVSPLAALAGLTLGTGVLSKSDKAAIKAADKIKAKDDLPGVFVDPRTDTAGNKAADEKLALDIAKKAAAGGASVPGNWLLDVGAENVSYKTPSTTPEAFSLGDYGPSIGIPVITVEVDHYYESNGDPDRVKELQAHAIALEEVFLGK
ncbi:MAG: hypothetical protein QM820_35520 [Minicystis sp.]